MILTRTPLRVSLFGGGTDYPEWFTEHGGACLGMAINQYVYVGVKHMPPGQLHESGAPLRYRVQYSHVDNCNEINEIKHPAVRAAVKHLRLDDYALEFHIFGDLPGRSGLGGSSAFTVGLLNALCHLLPGHAPQSIGHDMGGSYARAFEPYQLADDAIFLEQQVIQETVGCQDQILAAFGGLRFITFYPNKHHWHTSRIAFTSERRIELENSLALVYTGTMRDAHEMAARQIANFTIQAGTLHRFAELAQEGLKLICDHNTSLIGLGHLLHEAWLLKRKLCAGLTTNEIDTLYARGLSCGAVGGKLLGAGGGGFMLFFVPPEHRTGFNQGINAPVVSFKIAQEGSRVIIDK